MENKYAKWGGSALFIVGCGMNIVAPLFPIWSGWAFIGIGIFTYLYSIFPNRWIPELLRRDLFHAVAIAIVFDTTNPGEKYWRVVDYSDPAGKTGTVWQYKVLLRNLSGEVVRNARVAVEMTGTTPLPQEAGIFDITHGPVFDLTPQSEKFVVILRWPHPAIQAGMPFGRALREIYGNLKITVEADNLLQPIVRIFRFDYEKTPMLFGPLTA